MLSQSELFAGLEADLPVGLELLRQMVGINSFTLNAAGVNQLAEFTAASFAELGFTPTYVAATNPNYGRHLILTRAGGSARSIAMIAHLDTVFSPEEEQRNKFHWSVEGDRIFGPGTHDIKGGTISMWLVLRALQRHAPNLFESVTWKLMWNSAEEMFSPDFGDVCRAELGPEPIAALVFEAEGRLGEERLMVVARKGRATWRVMVSGRGSHAGGNHQHGANAVVQLGHLLPRIAAITDYTQNLTVNVGTITGGTMLNRVPHMAMVEGELRAFDQKVYEAGKKKLLALAGPGEVSSTVDRYRCQVSVEILEETRPWPRNPATDRLCEYWVAAGRELNLPVGSYERGGLSDGNLIWKDVPTLDGLGVWGDGGHCSERSADGSKLPEYVEQSGFVPRAAINTLALLKLIQAQ